MSELRVLIAAAGRGSRAGLPYPKTLYPAQGVPILIRIASLLAPYDTKPSVIFSPGGMRPIRNCLVEAGINAHLVIQPQALGMGNAVLHFTDSPAFEGAKHVLLVWGDIPFIQPETVSRMVSTHFDRASDFTFVTRRVDSAYTIVSRDTSGVVTEVIETREKGVVEPQPGERDIGLFVFRKEPVFAALREELDDKFGTYTGEHGFLYVIKHLALRGLRVEALPIATELDLVSLNRVEDLAGVRARGVG